MRTADKEKTGLLHRLFDKDEPEQEFIAATPAPLNMGELFAELSQFGKVQVGSWDRECVEVQLSFVGADFVSLKCKTFPTVEQNMAALLSRCRNFRRLYEAGEI